MVELVELLAEAIVKLLNGAKVLNKGLQRAELVGVVLKHLDKRLEELHRTAKVCPVLVFRVEQLLHRLHRPLLVAIIALEGRLGAANLVARPAVRLRHVNHGRVVLLQVSRRLDLLLGVGEEIFCTLWCGVQRRLQAAAAVAALWPPFVSLL